MDFKGRVLEASKIFIYFWKYEALVDEYRIKRVLERIDLEIGEDLNKHNIEVKPIDEIY